MTLIDIKTAIVTKIKQNITGANVLAMEVLQGFNKPAFFVEIVPTGKTNQNPNQFAKSVTVIIHYFSQNETNIENLQMQDQLETIFDMTLTVGGRVFTIGNTSGQIVDKVLNFSFELNYSDSRDEVTGDLMQNLNLKEGY